MFFKASETPFNVCKIYVSMCLNIILEKVQRISFLKVLNFEKVLEKI